MSNFGIAQLEEAVTAYSPLAKGQFDPIVEEVAAGIDRSPTQVTLRWLIEEGLLPKASSWVYLEENFDLSGWALPDEARDQIRSLGDD